MTRLFSEHIKRENFCLNGAWNSLADKENKGEKSGYQNGLPDSHSVIVPSVWNFEKGMLEYEGAVWYEKEFYTKGGTLRFSFGAVMTECKVYLDGELLGEHYGGFCKFSFTKEGVSEGIHRLTLKVSNAFDKRSIPKATVDWYHYGGITRSVNVERLSGICILYSFLDYELEESCAKCCARVELYNSSDKSISDSVRIYIGGKPCSEISVTLGGYESKSAECRFELSDIALWSPENPKLYEMKTETSSDDLYDRVGFRKIEIKGKDFVLNGTKILLKGVNRHEEHPEHGMAFPSSLMGRDLDIIESMNCNAIRGSHYPNDPLFVDMLDERGILFWSEVPMWGAEYGKDTFSDPVFFDRAMDMHREMVREYYNHPSVIIWGIFNETDTTVPETEAFAHTCYDFLKSEGGNRLITYATDKRTRDICLRWCDFISLNLYIGWYDSFDEGFDTWENTLKSMNEFFKKVGVSDKPLVMSEFGAAAIYGNHTFDNLKWTEEYQADLIKSCLELFCREGCSGTYIWQFCDIRTAKEMGINRARSFNNKGLLNEYRKPKLSYFTVKEFYKNLK